MNKYVPFIFPAIALAVVLFLGYRWYSLNTTDSQGQVSQFGDNVTVEELADADQAMMLTSADDFKTAELEGEGEAGGQVRYEVKDGKVRFSVMALLPAEAAPYQVWLKKVGGEELLKAFDLESGKGGYIGSAALAETTLPFEVWVVKAGLEKPTDADALVKATVEK